MWKLRTLALAGLVLASAPAHAQLKLLTWNVWGVEWVADEVDARMALIPDAAAEIAPDLILLQEAWEPRHGRAILARLRALGYPFGAHVSTEPRQAGLLIASRWPLRDVRFVPFEAGQTMLFPWHVDYMANKGWLSAIVEAPDGPLRVVNTHLQAAYRWHSYDTTRLSQAVQLGVALAQEPLPVILAGDINIQPEELGRRALRDLFGLEGVSGASQIDAALGRGVRIREAETVLGEARELGEGQEMPLSDHPALLVRVELGEAQRASVEARARWSEVLSAYQARRTRIEARTSVASWGLVCAVGCLGIALRRRHIKCALLSLIAALLLGFWSIYYAPQRGAELDASIQVATNFEQNRIPRPQHIRQE